MSSLIRNCGRELRSRSLQVPACVVHVTLIRERRTAADHDSTGDESRRQQCAFETMNHLNYYLRQW